VAKIRGHGSRLEKETIWSPCGRRDELDQFPLTRVHLPRTQFRSKKFNRRNFLILDENSKTTPAQASKRPRFPMTHLSSGLSPGVTPIAVFEAHELCRELRPTDALSARRRRDMREPPYWGRSRSALSSH